MSHPALLYNHAGWSDASEAEAKALWEAERFRWIMPSTDQSYITLWKTCIQYAACTLWDIIGERHCLRFQPDVAFRPGSNLMLTRGFCVTLSQVITHIIWPTQFEGALATSVAIALQYAVILRTNDQRPWDPAPRSIDQFYTMMRQQTNIEPMRTRHQRIRKSCADGHVIPSVLSDIFLALEDVVKPAKTNFSPPADGIYVVTVQDVENIVRELDNMANPSIGTLGHLPTSIQYFAAANARPHQSFPSKPQVKELHEAAMLEERRRRIIRLRPDEFIDSELPAKVPSVSPAPPASPVPSVYWVSSASPVEPSPLVPPPSPVEPPAKLPAELVIKRESATSPHSELTVICERTVQGRCTTASAKLAEPTAQTSPTMPAPAASRTTQRDFKRSPSFDRVFKRSPPDA